MSVRCSKCGEELLGRVNRCWKCGHAFALAPERDGRPPVRVQPEARVGQADAGATPLDAEVLEAGQDVPLPAAPQAQRAAAMPVTPAVTSAAARLRTADMVDARRARHMAMGGTVASLVLGVFASLLGLLWPPAALMAVVGLAMGIWGLSSPRRNLALVGMLLCCLAIGIGAFGGVRAVWLRVESRRAIEVQP